MTPRERLEARTYPDPNSGCYIYTGSAGVWGHARMRVEGRQVYVHRLAWLLAGWEIPDGLCVLHKCDTPCCVNVDHLFLGTDADNNRDKALKGRGRRGSKGLPYGAREQPNGKFQSQVRLNGVMVMLGTFDTAAEASAMALAAKYGALGVGGV